MKGGRGREGELWFNGFVRAARGLQANGSRIEVRLEEVCGRGLQADESPSVWFVNVLTRKSQQPIVVRLCPVPEFVHPSCSSLNLAQFEKFGALTNP